MFSYHLPAGMKWDLGDKDGTVAQSFGSDGFWYVEHGDFPARVGNLAKMAQIEIGDEKPDFPKGALKRIADRTVAGHNGYVVQGHGSGIDGFLWVWGTWENGTGVHLALRGPADNSKARKMLESILASIVWK